MSSQMWREAPCSEVYCWPCIWNLEVWMACHLSVRLGQSLASWHFDRHLCFHLLQCPESWSALLSGLLTWQFISRPCHGISWPCHCRLQRGTLALRSASKSCRIWEKSRKVKLRSSTRYVYIGPLSRCGHARVHGADRCAAFPESKISSSDAIYHFKSQVRSSIFPYLSYLLHWKRDAISQLCRYRVWLLSSSYILAQSKDVAELRCFPYLLG